MLGRLSQYRHGRFALPKRNAAYLLWRYLGNADRTWRAQTVGREYPEAQELGDALQGPGILCGSTASYLSDEGQSALKEVSRDILDKVPAAMASLKENPSSGRKAYLAPLVSRDIVHDADSAILKVALDTKLLEIVASYLGLWSTLFSMSAYVNFPIGEAPTASQLWHRDPEDMKIVKAFIYLTDVGEEQGPFCFIPETQSFGARARQVPFYKDSIRIEDEEMIAAIPKEHWMAYTGSKGTMILADTIGYHRGGYVLEGHRVLLTFTYTSGVPRKPIRAHIGGTPQWLKSPIQKAALPDTRLVKNIAAGTSA